MKKNFPVSGIEKPFTSGLIVSRTDLKGIIRHVNDAFVDLSGFTREELLGQSHNIVRHPEMPPVLFEDLWNTLKQGQPWRGLVKNRCQNGDHYWVDALVVPVRERGQVTGYMSVRTPANREGVRQAEALYPRLLNGEKFNKPKQPGINEQPVRWLAAALLASALLAEALLPPGLPATLMAGLGLATLAGLMAFEQKRASRQARLLAVCEHIAEGRLDNELVINGKGENGRLETALACMQVHLKVVIDDLQMTARALEGDSRQLTASLHDIFQRIEASNGSIEQICAAVEQLSASIEQVARHAGDTAALSQNSSHTIRQSSGDILQAREQSEAAARTVGDAQDTIRSLSDAIADVGKVTQTIHDIAEQTNLLALNAAIEAARAGETGRGFAVVADEVRKLAERTSSSTDEIKNLVGSIRKASDDTVSAMLKVNSETQAGTEAQQRTSEQLQTIQASAEDVRRMMEEVAGTNTQQSETANHLSERMADIAHQLGETHRHIDQAHGTVTGFADKAKSLSKLAGHFQLQAD